MVLHFVDIVVIGVGLAGHQLARQRGLRVDELKHGLGRREDGFARWLISTALGLMNFDVEFGIPVACFQPIILLPWIMDLRAPLKTVLFRDGGVSRVLQSSCIRPYTPVFRAQIPCPHKKCRVLEVPLIYSLYAGSPSTRSLFQTGIRG